MEPLAGEGGPYDGHSPRIAGRMSLRPPASLASKTGVSVRSLALQPLDVHPPIHCDGIQLAPAAGAVAQQSVNTRERLCRAVPACREQIGRL